MTEKILVDIHDFLQPYLPLVNTHNVDYLIYDHWNTYVPEWIRQYQQINLYDLFEQRYKQENLLAQNQLEKFIDEIIKLKRQIEQITYTREKFEKDILQEKYKTQANSFKYINRTFMSQKKEHEVDILAPIIDQLANMSQSESVRNFI